VACYTIKKSYDYRNNPVKKVIASVYDKWMIGKVAKAEQLVALTNADADDWRTYIPRVVVIPNPVTAYPETILPHDGSGHRILCVGRLESQKGFDMLIEAFALIANQCKDWFIDIYGDGTDKAMLTNMICRNNLVGRININAPIATIFDEYQRSEFFVLSSRFEGFGLVLIEAMSCGIPCVSFKCKYGPEDLIDDTVTGLLVDNGNVKELADKILWMINHKDERLLMGQKARQAAARFDKDAIMQKWHDLFSHHNA
jgi:glycosyltransferase involved in cell wall biosynthesis